MRNEECTLITGHAVGGQIEKHEETVFCEKISCSRNEYYAAYAVGLRPKFMLSIFPPDFELGFVMNADGTVSEPTQVKYQGRVYNILRTYEKDMDTMELTVG